MDPSEVNNMMRASLGHPLGRSVAMDGELVPVGMDVYAERAMALRMLALSVDSVKDNKTRDLMREAMTRLIGSIGPEVASIKGIVTPFLKPAS